MKKWVEKLIEQFDLDWNTTHGAGNKGANGAGQGVAMPGGHSMSEERATLLYVIDTYNKHLLEFDGHPVRKVREMLDEFAKEILNPRDGDIERVLFRFRQFFSTYRIDESAYFQRTFEEFRTIIWDFVDQLAHDMSEAQKEDFEIRTHLEGLKEAVESNSIDVLKNESRKFIDCYVEKQFKKDQRNSTRMRNIRKNLNVVKKQLSAANDSARTDHLTGAFNRKSFDEYCLQQKKLFAATQVPVTMILTDIDYFKRINDSYGHPIGDFVLKELVGTLKKMFQRDADFIARIGGEEFVIILPDYKVEHAVKKAEEVLARVRAEAYVTDQHTIRFTVSMGIAELAPGEEVESWLKRADLALYHSKNTGRNRATVAPEPLVPKAA